MEYRRAKASRKLNFLPSMGSVTLELEFEFRKLTVEARPAAVMVLSFFTSKGIFIGVTRDYYYHKLTYLRSIDY